MDVQPFVLERTLNTPIAKVWTAISNPGAMKQWYFDLPGFRPEVGYQFEFYGGADEHNPYRHLCEVKEAVPGKKLVYSWRYDGYEGDSLVTFELFEEGGNTRLRLTHSGLETFPAQKDFAKENFAMGWTELIGKSLTAYLGKV